VRGFIFLLLFLVAFQGLFEQGPPAARGQSSEKREQIERIEKDLSREREQYLKFREKEKELLHSLTAVEKEIEEKQGALREIESRTARIKRELVEGQGELGKLENALSDVESRLGRRLDSFYRYARRGYARLFSSAEGLDILRKRIKYLKAVMKDDLELLHAMAELKQKYRREIAGVKERLALLERLEKAESNHLAALKEDIDRRVVLLMRIHREKEFYNTAVRELELAAQNLRATLLGLEKKGEAKTAALPARFDEAKGKLPLPLGGRIIRDEGADGPKGILIEAPSGSEVKAVFPGRVDFSGTLKGYGQVIVINHGARYFTVSAQLGKRTRQTGEEVRAGEVIGALAETLPPQTAQLYFEIRMGVGNEDPLKWLKVH